MKIIKKSILILPILIILFSFTIAPTVSAECKCYCGSETVKYSPAADDVDCGKKCNNVQPVGESMNKQKPCSANPIESSSSKSKSNCSGSQICLDDPLNLHGDLSTLYANIIIGLLGFVGIASLVAFVYAGFMFLISAGNPERVKKAKDIIVYAIIGIIVSMASYAILSFIFKTLEMATGNK